MFFAFLTDSPGFLNLVDGSLTSPERNYNFQEQTEHEKEDPSSSPTSGENFILKICLIIDHDPIFLRPSGSKIETEDLSSVQVDRVPEWRKVSSQGNEEGRIAIRE